jgi:hypothetical protein
MDEEEIAKAQALADHMGMHTTWAWDIQRDGIVLNTEIHAKTFVAFENLDLAAENAEEIRKKTETKLHQLIILAKSE